MLIAFPKHVQFIIPCKSQCCAIIFYRARACIFFMNDTQRCSSNSIKICRYVSECYCINFHASNVYSLSSKKLYSSRTVHNVRWCVSCSVHPIHCHCISPSFLSAQGDANWAYRSECHVSNGREVMLLGPSVGPLFLADTTNCSLEKTHMRLLCYKIAISVFVSSTSKTFANIDCHYHHDC